MTWATRQQQTITSPGTRSILLAVPNGSGPGIVTFGSEDCFVEWTVTSVRDRVPVINVYHTGCSNRDQLWIADGAQVVAVVKLLAAAHFDSAAIEDTAGQIAPRIWASWTRADSAPPRLDHWDLATGLLNFPITTLSAGQTSDSLGAPGFCRYFLLRSTELLSFLMETQAAPNGTAHWDIPAPGVQIVSGPIGAWESFTVRNLSASVNDYAISFDRYPITGE